MILFDRAHENAAALKNLGAKAREESRQIGKPVRYLDPAYGNDIIREYPDGRRERLTGGGEVVALPPR